MRVFITWFVTINKYLPSVNWKGESLNVFKGKNIKLTEQKQRIFISKVWKRMTFERMNFKFKFELKSLVFFLSWYKIWKSVKIARIIYEESSIKMSNNQAQKKIIKTIKKKIWKNLTFFFFLDNFSVWA